MKILEEQEICRPNKVKNILIVTLGSINNFSAGSYEILLDVFG